jgi:hypothetical protein
MKGVTDWFYRTATMKKVVLMSLVYLLFPLYVLPAFFKLGTTGPLDLLFWYDGNTAYDMISAYGQEIRLRYILGLLTADVAYPIYYGSVIATVIALIVKKLSITTTPKVILLPFIMTSLDLLENALIVTLLSRYPKQYPLLGDFAGYATASKWTAAVGLVIFILILIIYGLRIRRRHVTTQ